MIIIQHLALDLTTANITFTQYQYITQKFMPDAVKFFKSALSVIPYPSVLKINESKCYQTNIPIYLQSNGSGVYADIIFFVSAVYDPISTYAAWATACWMSGYDNR